MAIVPLLLIKMKVMMAIRIRGISVPPITKAKTLPVSGQGTVVDKRTVIYPVKNEPKMKVSLSRKIHIIALPQLTLNDCLSEDQSATMSRHPEGSARDPAVFICPRCALYMYAP